MSKYIIQVIKEEDSGRELRPFEIEGYAKTLFKGEMDSDSAIEILSHLNDLNALMEIKRLSN